MLKHIPTDTIHVQFSLFSLAGRLRKTGKFNRQKSNIGRRKWKYLLYHDERILKIMGAAPGTTSRVIAKHLRNNFDLHRVLREQGFYDRIISKEYQHCFLPISKRECTCPCKENNNKEPLLYKINFIFGRNSVDQKRFDKGSQHSSLGERR